LARLGFRVLPNKGFEANDYFNNFATPVVGRQNLVRNQFGASFGGPIVKDKFFFFFDYNARGMPPRTRLLRPCHDYVRQRSNHLREYQRRTSTLTTTAQVAALDPLGLGQPQP